MDKQLSKNSNIYDKLLILTISLQFFGVMGGSLQPVRIFVIFLIPMVFTFFLKKRKISYQYKYELFLFSFWIIYGIITLIWAIIPINSLKEILYLFLNFFSFLTIIYFASKSLNPQKSIIQGWFLLFLLTLPIAFYELWFDKHLPMSFQDEAEMLSFGAGFISRRFTSVTFGNLNGYNTMLCYMMPFVFGYLFVLKIKWQTALVWISAICLSYIIIVNGSRGAFIDLLIGLFIFISFKFKTRKLFLTFIITTFVLIYIIIYYFSDDFSIIIMRFAVQGFGDDFRTLLITNGWDAFVKSGMFGIGANNFMPTMAKYYHLRPMPPHNLFLEIGVQYGLIIFLLFLGLIVRIFLKQKVNPSSTSKFIILASLFMFPLSSTIDSGYILGIGVWLFLASLYIISDKQYNVI